MSTLQLFEPASSTYTYIIFDTATRHCVIIDPVDVTSARDIQVGALRQSALRASNVVCGAFGLRLYVSYLASR